MKFTKLSLVGDQTIDFPIIGISSSDSYILRGVDGLGPPTIGPGSSNPHDLDRVVGDRQVVMLIGLVPNYAAGETVEGLRENLYSMYSPVIGYTTLKIMDDSTELAYTTGYVSNIEISPFSADPLVQITLDCIQSYFQYPSVIQTDLSSQTTQNLVLQNIGSAPVGFKLEQTLSSVPGALVKLIDSDAFDTKAIQLEYTFLVNDYIIIDTRKGSRDILLGRDGSYTSIIDAMTDDSTWLYLKKGANNFVSTAGSVWVSYDYTPQYLGV